MTRVPRIQVTSAMLVALLGLATGAQALAPASAGAVTAQGTGSTCVHYDFLPPGSGFRSDGTACTILATSGGGGAGTNPTPTSTPPYELEGEIIEVQSLGPGDCDSMWPPGGRCSGPLSSGEQRPRRDPDAAKRAAPPVRQKPQRPAQSAQVRKSCEDMAATLRKLARPLIQEALTTARPADGNTPFKARGKKSYINDYLNAKGPLESNDPTMKAFGEWGTRVLDNIRNLVRDYKKCQGVSHRNRWTLGSSPQSTA